MRAMTEGKPNVDSRRAAMVVVLGLLVVACSDVRTGSDRVRGSGEVTVEARSIAEFERVVLAGEGDVLFGTGSDGLVDVETDDNLLIHIRTDVSGDTLTISTEPGIVPSASSSARTTGSTAAGVQGAIGTGVPDGSVIAAVGAVDTVEGSVPPQATARSVAAIATRGPGQPPGPTSVVMSFLSSRCGVWAGWKGMPARASTDGLGGGQLMVTGMALNSPGSVSSPTPPRTRMRTVSPGLAPERSRVTE